MYSYLNTPRMYAIDLSTRITKVCMLCFSLIKTISFLNVVFESTKSTKFDDKQPTFILDWLAGYMDG